MPVMLSATRAPVETHDLAMLDLDGVVYIGGHAVPGASAALSAARTAGMRLAFVTNNASRTPRAVADHLVDLGVQAGPDDVVTSAQAAARVLLGRLGAGASVATMGAEGLRAALRAEGLVPVDVDATAAAIVTGYGPEVRWQEIMRAAVRIRDGLWWVASNTDLTIPTPYGEAPGNGVLVQTLATFSGVTPVVAGKPARPLLDETIRRVGGSRPLMVGDRLDTDIAGAIAVGVDSLLVMTGVTSVHELAQATPAERPTWISADLGGLLHEHPQASAEDGQCVVGGWRAEVVSGAVQVDGEGDTGSWWRAVAVACWAWLDSTGEPARVVHLRPPAPSRTEKAKPATTDL